MTNPVDDDELLSSITLGGMVSPGVVTLSGHEREQTIDVQEAKGQSGASTVRQGEKVGSFTATFYLVTDPSSDRYEIDEWAEFQIQCESTVRGKSPVALEVYHPDLIRNNFKAVILKKMGALQYDKKGGATIAVVFTEYFPKKAVSSSGPNGAKSKKDPFDQKIDDATATLNELMGNSKKP